MPTKTVGTYAPPALSLRDSGACVPGADWTRRQITTTVRDLQVSTVKAVIAATVARRNGPEGKAHGQKCADRRLAQTFAS